MRLCWYAFQGVACILSPYGAFTEKPPALPGDVYSVANVMSYQFPALSLGVWLMIWNGILILGQILLLRSKFQLIQLLQIPISFLFGCFTDFGTWCISWIPVNSYLAKLCSKIFYESAETSFNESSLC